MPLSIRRSHLLLAAATVLVFSDPVRPQTQDPGATARTECW